MKSLFLFTLTFLSGCVSSDNIAGLTGVNTSPTVAPVATPAGPSTKPLAFLRITNGATLTPYPGTTLNISNTIPLRAILVGDSGTLIQDVNVAWTVNNSLAPTDLTTPNGIGVQEVASFTASKISSGSISATIINFSDPVFKTYNLVTTTSVTGPIAVSYTLAADTISKDASSGDGQTVQAGTIPAADLRVKVTNAGGVSVPGVTVNFSPSAGNNGSVVLCGSGSGDAVTNSSGVANCTVRLGGTLGTGNQVFTATIPTGSSRTTSFALTSTFGTPNKLKFTQDPQGPSKGTSLSTLPILVEIEDQFGNRVLNATNSVTISKDSPAGGGTITSGVLTVSASSGVASFVAIGYSIAELNVKFRAVSAGLTDALTASFDVSDVIQQGRCASETSGFITAEGGCKDTSTGLIWSASSDTTPSLPAGFNTNGLSTWGQTVWDESVFALNSSTSTETSLNITTDKDLTNPNGQGSANNPDYNALAYCHSLVESGYDDWRVPTFPEMGSARSDGAPVALKDTANRNYWTSSSCNTNGISDGLDVSRGNCSGNASAFYVRCVRQSPPARLVIQNPTAPTKGFGAGVTFENPPIVKVAETNGATVKRSGVVIRLTAYRSSDNSAVGLVSNGLQVTYAQITTDSTGTAVFNGVGVNASGSIYFKANALNTVGTIDYTLLTAGTSAPIAINATYPYALCLTEDANWKNSGGGCKEMGSGAIWSSVSTNRMSWDDAIWDYGSTGVSAPRASDNGRSDDYAQGMTASPGDSSSRNYCHDSVESGFTDWKIPATAEGASAGGHTPLSYIRPPNDWFWVNNPGTNNDAGLYYIPGNYGGGDYRANAHYVMCVRRDPPTQIITAVSSPDQAPNYSIGGNFNLTILLKDADGAPSKANGNVTISLVGGTGSITEGGVSRGSSFTKSVTGGRLVLSLLYNKAESIQLSVTGTAAWNSANTTLTASSTASMTFSPPVAGLCDSAAPSGWANDVLGGCKDTVSGLVWSPAGTNGYAWYATSNFDADCIALRLGAYSDWRTPTPAEWTTAIGHQVSVAVQSWQLRSYYGSTVGATVVDSVGNTVINPYYGSGVYVRCVRGP